MRKLALIYLTKQTLHIKYGCDIATLYITNIRGLGLLLSDEDFCSVSICKASDSWDGAIFYPRTIIVTSLVKAYWIKLHTKYQKAWDLFWTRRLLKSFSCQVKSQCGATVYPRPIIRTILIKVYKIKLHIKYQKPELSCFIQEDF